MKIEDQLKNLLAEHLGLGKREIFGTDRIQEDLGADSLDAVEIVMALEQEYGIEIPDSDAERLETVDEMVAYLKKVTGRD